MARLVNKRVQIVRAQEAGSIVGRIRHPTARKPGRFQEVLTIAKEKGLLKGARTELVRGRMPKALVARAKARSGVQSDTKLIEVALANLAVADEYPTWLIAQHGTVSKDLDLEF
jgi:hypothetical protein